MRRHRPNAAINVLFIDDHTVARDGYRRTLAQDSQLKLLGEENERAPELQLKAQEPLPDVIVLDISLPGMSGIDTLRRVMDARPTRARVLMFSQYQDPLYVSHAFDAGAHGYLTKSSAPEMLLTAINAVASGRRFVSPDVQRALSESNGKIHEIASSLSHREHEILRLLSDGYTLNEIGERLGITPKTVANRQTAIKQKLGAGTAVQLIVIARRLGLCSPPSESVPEQQGV
jgi:two-component system invasion response regulator UvrY